MEREPLAERVWMAGDADHRALAWLILEDGRGLAIDHQATAITSALQAPVVDNRSVCGCF